MNRLDRYLIRHIAELTGLVALALLAIYTFVAFVSDINDIGKGFDVPHLMAYTALKMPASLYILMPIIGLLGTMLGIGALARQSELTAMRAAGVSMLRIGAATLVAGAVLGGFTVLLGDWIAPAGERAAELLRDKARGVSPSRSVWLRDGQDFIQIGSLLSENEVAGVVIYHLDENGRISDLLAAASGRYLGDHWQLNNVRQTRFMDGRVDVTSVPQLDVSGTLNPAVLRLFILEEDTLSFRGLSRLIDYMRSNQLDFSKYEVLLWRKLVEPFTVMAMMIFALPFVLGRMRDTGAGQRLLLGALIGIAFYVINKICLSYGSLYRWPAPLAAGIPTTFLAAYAAWRLGRAR